VRRFRMTRAAVLASLVLACSVPAWATEQTVTFKSGDEQGSGFLATPEGKGPFPAVLVIQEWWGLTDWVKDQARALAKDGYKALAVDLYRGKVGDTQEVAHELMNALPRDRAMRDLHGALVYLQGLPDVKKGKVGTIGWCMGGGYSFAMATTEPSLAAVVVYYGAPPTDAEAIARIKAPILGNFGAEDKGPTPDQVAAFQAAAKAAGKSFDAKVYPGAGHAFANPNNPWHGYREEAAKDAWSRTLAFFSAQLKK
jgi:carboxymethylenebutenolidase